METIAQDPADKTLVNTEAFELIQIMTGRVMAHFSFNVEDELNT